ncbi:glycosyltransferase family 1 protein [Amniculicola lignicola CBS 123094]|uniref:UDP-N-acetylglucosamine transferase subunit ALG14 n=1 Tax=Amniculicola lignicola CBS 123094 TaxID=1392246 RepID=A0A6A5WV67_9PLEO|nr:glycosyltransferase family 1 protein [Amniculicola lignicola CBS 123094]
MAPPPLSLYTTSFLLATLVTLLVAGSLRLLYILPHTRFQRKPLPRRKPIATRVLIVLGSGGHTHEMLELLRDLDTSTYTHRTYVVGRGDAFSAQRAVKFEEGLEARERARLRESEEYLDEQIDTGAQKAQENTELARRRRRNTTKEDRPTCLGPAHYDIAIIPRARAIHQSLLTTPVTALYTLISSFRPLVPPPPPVFPILTPSKKNPNANPPPPPSPYDVAAHDLPTLILTNGPATACILILASLILKFFDIRGAQRRRMCKTIYVESFARVKTLSLSGKLLVWVVDRFLVQWKELEGKGGGRAEFWGVLV